MGDPAGCTGRISGLKGCQRSEFMSPGPACVREPNLQPQMSYIGLRGFTTFPPLNRLQDVGTSRFVHLSEALGVAVRGFFLPVRPPIAITAITPQAPA